MDFFSSQDKARRNTLKLIILFGLAVISMIIFTNILVMVVFGFLGSGKASDPLVDWFLFGVVSVCVLTVVGLGSLYKIAMLSGGGSRIAEQMNGKLIVDRSGDVAKQRLLNIVEEMAIASGVPVPPVYLVPGNAINAFAAGHTPSDAIIGVSQGAIEQLTRDELQGVIGHEFSHILNGDMRLNIRLVGVLHGILLIGMIGYYLLRFTPRSRNSKGSGGILALGLGMVVIGYSGTFFGNLIKAAVNRQREYLADSAAVQFTRNPDGIGGALIRIGAAKNGSVLDIPGSAEISHSLFSQGFTSSLNAFFATHPPLKERIKRILPNWDGAFRPAAAPPPSPERVKKEVDPKERLSRAQVGMMAAGAAVLSQEKVMAEVGRPTEKHLAGARTFLDELPEDFKNTLHSPYGAQAVIYVLVLDRDKNERAKQLEYLGSTAGPGIFQEISQQYRTIQDLGTDRRLPLIDLALPALRQLSNSQYMKFREILTGLIAADKKISFFEWTLQKLVIHHLDSVFAGTNKRRHKEPTIKRAKEAGTILVSLFVNTMKQKGLTRREVFAEALKEISWIDEELLESSAFTLTDLDAVLADLAGLKPRYKKMLLKACAAVVLADKQVTPRETELLRAVSAGLDCPMPPFIR